MDCHLELKKGSSDRTPFVAVKKKVLTKQTQRSIPLDKRGISYSEFHREITKKVEDVCPKRLENHLKSRIGRTASGERDLVKYKSYVPSYTKKCEKVEEKYVKVGSIGSQDRRNRQLGDKQMDKHTRSSLSNTSTSSSLWTDESSTDSNRGLSASPFRKRINHPPLQFYLMSSKPGDCFQDCEPPRDYGDTSQSHSFLPRNITDRHGQLHQSSCAAAFQQNEKKDSDFKVVPKTKAFLGSSKLDSPSCTRVMSKNLADDFKKKGEKLDERIRNPHVHDLFGKEKPAAVFVPGIVSQKQLIGLSKFYDSKVLLAERVTEANRKGLPERLACGKDTILDSNVGPFQREADGSKPFLKRISFLSGEKISLLSERSRSAPRSRKAESSPSRSMILDRRSTETLSKESDQKAAKVVSPKARSNSPFRRLSFSIGKSSKNSNNEDAQTPPHLRAGLDNPSKSSSDGSSVDKTNAANRGRSSPLRRLLEPLIKPKASHLDKSHEPSQKHMLSTSQPSSSIPPSRTYKSSTVQALFRITSKNDQPLFTFAVEKEQSITAATIRKQISTEKEEFGSQKYTFFTVQEGQKKTGKWMNNNNKKVQSQDFTSNIVAQMRVSGSIDTREFVLFGSESHRPTELAAMVIKIPKIANTILTKFGDYFADIDTTVVLPSGIHSLPHKGGPSSLIQRWKSGGSCDCGGWDIGCNLQILTNQENKPRNSYTSTSDAFKLFFQVHNTSGLVFFF